VKNNLSNNIKLSYLFRDAGNYKMFDYVVLSNPTDKSAEEIDDDLRRRLIDGAYFYPEQVQLPVLQDSSIEGMWHEYEKVEVTDKEVTDERAIGEIIGLMGGAQNLSTFNAVSKHLILSSVKQVFTSCSDAQKPEQFIFFMRRNRYFHPRTERYLISGYTSDFAEVDDKRPLHFEEETTS